MRDEIKPEIQIMHGNDISEGVYIYRPFRGEDFTRYGGENSEALLVLNSVIKDLTEYRNKVVGQIKVDIDKIKV